MRDERKNPKLRDDQIHWKGGVTWHDHLIAGVGPEGEKRLRQAARKRAKENYGWPEKDLTELYGPPDDGE